MKMHEVDFYTKHIQVSANLHVRDVDYTTILVSVRVGISLTSLITIVTPTDRPKSVRNRCVIEFYGGVIVL